MWEDIWHNKGIDITVELIALLKATVKDRDELSAHEHQEGIPFLVNFAHGEEF